MRQTWTHHTDERIRINNQRQRPGITGGVWLIASFVVSIGMWTFAGWLVYAVVMGGGDGP